MSRSCSLLPIVLSRTGHPINRARNCGAMSKFSLSKASGAKESNKRPAEAAASGGSPYKIPKVSEITIEAGPKPLAAPRRRPQIAPVQVCIYKYTNDAGDCWEVFKGDNVPLWQVQIDHNAQELEVSGHLVRIQTKYPPKK